MGQMTSAIMYGSEVAKLPDGMSLFGDSAQVDGKWVYQKGLVELYDSGRGPELDSASDSGLIGFWVAAGASGKEDCADLDEPVALDAVATTDPYKKPHDRAVKAWTRFAKWCKTQGVELGEPRLWLVQTEVA